MAGGDEATKLLHQSVTKYLRQEYDSFIPDQKIVISVYADLRSLTRIYVEKNVVPGAQTFNEFVLGFNKAHPLFDFIDAGNHEEAADTQIKEFKDVFRSDFISVEAAPASSPSLPVNCEIAGAPAPTASPTVKAHPWRKRRVLPMQGAHMTVIWSDSTASKHSASLLEPEEDENHQTDTGGGFSSTPELVEDVVPVPISNA